MQTLTYLADDSHRETNIEQGDEYAKSCGGRWSKCSVKQSNSNDACCNKAYEQNDQLQPQSRI